MDLFLCERKGRGTDELVRLCLARYEIAGLGDARIERSEAGKPYLAGDLGVHFSVSHSAGLWACLTAGVECGLDIQAVTERDTDALAGRFFTDDEKEYVRKNGAGGFFDIWVRKEAAAKCLGMPLMRMISKASFSDGELLLDHVICCGEALRVAEKELPFPDMKCAVCLRAGGAERMETDIIEID